MSTTEAPSAPPAAVVSNEAVVKSEPPAPQSGDNAAAESKNDATETVKEEIPVQNTDSVPKPDSAPADPKPEILDQLRTERRFLFTASSKLVKALL